jgi:hypothetical protein
MKEVLFWAFHFLAVTMRAPCVTTQVMTLMMMILIGARGVSYHQTKYRRGGVCTLADALLLLLIMVGRSEGALLENNADYQACLSNPADCTRLYSSITVLTGPLPTQLGTLTALTHL